MTRLHRPPAAPFGPLIWYALREWRDGNKLAMRFFEKYGDIVWLRKPGKDVYLISNPAYVKHILADSAENYPKNFLSGVRGIVLGESMSSTEGAHWKRHRRMVQPAFQRDKLMALTPKFVGAIERVLDKHWEPYARSGEPMEVYRQTSRMAVTLMGQMTCSEDMPDDICEAAYYYMLYSIRSRFQVDELLPLPPKLARSIARKKYPKVRPSALRLNDFVWERVRERMARAEPSDDLLGHLVAAKDDQGVKFTDVEVRDEFMEFLYGGHVSPSISMAWTLYCLSQNDEVRERMFDTVDRALGGRLPTAQDFPALQYVGQVYDETLRHHSPAPGVGRPAINDDKLGDYDVPKGTVVATTAYVMHRHPAYWKNPDAFDPSHFDPEQVRARPRFVYLPFGAGQRVCIGAQLAAIYGTLVNAMVAQRYRLEMVPGRPVRSVTGGAHYPDNLWMKVVPARARRSSPASTTESPVSAAG